MKKSLTQKLLILAVCTLTIKTTNAQNTFPAVGDVGIGTITPKTKFHIEDGNFYQRTTLNQNHALTLSNKTVNKNWNIYQLSSTDVTPNGFLLEHYNGSYFVRCFTIDQTGNVGIGTSSPKTKFHIEDGNFYQRTTLNQNHALTLSNKTVNKNWNIYQLSSTDVTPNGFLLEHYNGSYFIRCFTVDQTGNVGIGTLNPTHKLSVNGAIRAKEILVDAGWSDFVFDDNYKLRSLAEVEQFIKANKHLPEIPSQQQVEKNGVQLGEVSSKLLMKIEELTLYMVEMNKKVEKLEKENTMLKSIIVNTQK